MSAQAIKASEVIHDQSFFLTNPTGQMKTGRVRNPLSHILYYPREACIALTARRCRFGTQSEFSVGCPFGAWSKGSFWYIQRGRGVVLVHTKGQRCCFGTYMYSILHYLDTNTELLSMKNRR